MAFTTIGVIDGAITGLWIMFWIMLVISLIFFVFMFVMYPLKLIIWQRRGNSYTLRIERGRIYNDRGARVLLSFPKFFKMAQRVNIPAPSYDQLKLTGNDNVIIELAQTNLGSYVPVNRLAFNEQLNAFKVHEVDADVRLWETQRSKELKERYSVKSFWEKHGFTIALSGSFLIFTVLILLGMDMYTKQMEITAATVSSVSQSQARNNPTPAVNNPALQPEPPQVIQAAQNILGVS